MILIICGASWTGTHYNKAHTSQVLVPRRDGEYKSSTECEISPDISDWRSLFSLPVSHRYPQMNKGLRSLLCCPVWIGGLGATRIDSERRILYSRPQTEYFKVFPPTNPRSCLGAISSFQERRFILITYFCNESKVLEWTLRGHLHWGFYVLRIEYRWDLEHFI